MGHLDEPTFTRHLAACPRCGGTALEIATYLDRHVELMLGDPVNDGKWVHDGEKFVDGVYRITCVACRVDLYASDDCPRCHAAATLPATLAAPSHLAVPKRCPRCQSTQTSIIAMAPAAVRTTGGRPPTPTPRAELHDPGFHVVAVACDECDWAETAPGCALCTAPPPLRPRP